MLTWPFFFGLLKNSHLGGGFKYFLFPPRKIGEDEPNLTNIFFKNHQPVMVRLVPQIEMVNIHKAALAKGSWPRFFTQKIQDAIVSTNEMFRPGDPYQFYPTIDDPSCDGTWKTWIFCEYIKMIFQQPEFEAPFARVQCLGSALN